MNQALRLNFIPPQVQNSQMRGFRLRRWGIVVAVVLLLDLIPIFMHWQARAHVEVLAAKAGQLEIQLEQLRNEVKHLQIEGEDVALQLERASALRAKRSWSAMLAMIARTMPDTCWLTSFATDPDTPSAVQQVAVVPLPVANAAVSTREASTAPAKSVVVVDAPRKLSLMGKARSAADPLTFVTRLREEHIFKSVLLERTVRGPGPEEPFQFQISCQW